MNIIQTLNLVNFETIDADELDKIEDIILHTIRGNNEDDGRGNYSFQDEATALQAVANVRKYL